MLRRFLAAFFSIVLVCGTLLLSGCGDNKGNPYHQLEMPAVGDEIAIMHTNMGDITLRFFPEAAPLAVENFITHSKNGYYNGLTFHRVISDFMIQGGDPTGTGRGGESIWKKDFKDEFDPNLMNIRGALSMANSGANTNGSQFFIVQAGADVFDGWDVYEANKATATYDYDSWTDAQKKIYEENGGTPWLDGGHRRDGMGHTVFGQVISGMDVVDKIAAVQADGNGVPLEPVTIESIEVVEYQG